MVGGRGRDKKASYVLGFFLVYSFNEISLSSMCFAFLGLRGASEWCMHEWEENPIRDGGCCKVKNGAGCVVNRLYDCRGRGKEVTQVR